jgi:hypothetical protein
MFALVGDEESVGKCSVTYLWSGAPLELGFDLPGEVGLAVFAKDDVVTIGVEVLCVQ